MFRDHFGSLSALPSAQNAAVSFPKNKSSFMLILWQMKTKTEKKFTFMCSHSENNGLLFETKEFAQMSCSEIQVQVLEAKVWPTYPRFC